MIFLAILFALSILVIEYTIAQKFLEKDASILVYAGGIVVVLFIAIIDGLLFTMGLTEKVDVTATYLGLCLPSGLLLLAFARMLFGVIKKMAQENPKKIIEIGNEKKPRMLPTNIWGVSMAAIFYGFFATAAGICMLLAVALKFNGGISSLVGAAAALIAVLLINSQYPKRLRSELIEGNVISEDTQTYQGEERRNGSISAKDKGDILCYVGVLLAFLIYCFSRNTTIAAVVLFLGVMASLPYYRKDTKERNNRS